MSLHPQWDPDKIVNDIAVLELEDDLQAATALGAACLPNRSIAGRRNSIP